MNSSSSLSVLVVNNNNDSSATSKMLGIVDPPNGYGRPVFTSTAQQQQQTDLLRYHVDVIDRHNDSGYSTRPGESSQGPSPSLSGSILTSSNCLFIR